MRPRAAKEKKPAIGLEPEFTDTIASASAEEIKAKMILVQKGIEEAKEFKKTAPAIIDARAELQKILGPTNDTIKGANNKLKFMVDRLKEIGAL